MTNIKIYDIIKSRQKFNAVEHNMKGGANFMPYDYSKLYGGAEDFQRLLIRNKAITKAKDVCSLACAIFIYSDAVKTRANAKNMLYKFFNAKKENVDELLSYADKG